MPGAEYIKEIRKGGGVCTKPKDIKLIQTCEMCPEQYDALDANGNIIGYLRVRWGYFAVYCPDDGSDDAVYSAEIQGHGAFFNNTERKRHLRKAKAAIAKWWKGGCHENHYKKGCEVVQDRRLMFLMCALIGMIVGGITSLLMTLFITPPLM